MKRNAPIYIIIIVAITLMIIHLMRINYDDLSWAANKTPFLGILVAVIILIVGIIRLRKY